MTIRLSATVSNANLPLGIDTEQVLTLDADLEIWATADDSFCSTTSTNIDTFNDRLGRTRYFTAVGDATRAVLTAAQLGDYAAAHFEGSSTNFDDYVSSGFTLGAGAFSFAAIVRVQDVGENHAVMGRYTDTTNRAVMQITTSNFPRALVANGSATSARAMVAGTWELIIVSFDGTTGVSIWHRGATVTGVISAGTTHTGALRLGTLQGTDFQAFDGDLADAWVFNRDILDDPADTAFAAIVELAEDEYAIAVS